MESNNHTVNSNRHMVIFLGTSNDGISAQQEVGCRIAETFKIPLAKVLAAMMRAPFPVSRGLSLEAANDLVQTLCTLGANAVADSEGEWPSEERVLLNLHVSRPGKAPSSSTAEQDPSVAAQTRKSNPASKPAAAAAPEKAKTPVAGNECVVPAFQILRNLGQGDVPDSENSEPSEVNSPPQQELALPEEIQPLGTDEQDSSVAAQTEKIVSAVKPASVTDQVEVKKPQADDQCVTTSVETEPEEPSADGMTDIENPAARSSEKPATAVPATPPTQLGENSDFYKPDKTPMFAGKIPHRLRKYLAPAAAVLLLLAIGERVVSHTGWLPFSFGRDMGTQAHLTEQSTLEKQLYLQAQALEEFGSNSQVILTAWQDYTTTCPDGQFADQAKQHLSYWQDYRAEEPVTPPVSEPPVPQTVKRKIKPQLKTKAMVPIPDFNDPEPLGEPSSTMEVAAVENLPDFDVDMPSNSPLPDSPVRVGAGVTAPVIVYRVEPEFPKMAQRLKAEGEVVLQATILRDGSVSDVQVLQSPSNKLGCDKAAVEALEKWKFQPGMMSGQPVDVIIELTIKFVL